MENKYYVEYSPKQKQFHIDTIDNIINTNLRNIISTVTLKDGGQDYYVVFGPATMEEAYESIDHIRGFLFERNPEVL